MPNCRIILAPTFSSLKLTESSFFYRCLAFSSLRDTAIRHNGDWFSLFVSVENYINVVLLRMSVPAVGIGNLSYAGMREIITFCLFAYKSKKLQEKINGCGNYIIFFFGRMWELYNHQGIIYLLAIPLKSIKRMINHHFERDICIIDHTL